MGSFLLTKWVARNCTKICGGGTHVDSATEKEGEFKKALTFIIVASRVRRMFFLKLGPLTVLAVI